MKDSNIAKISTSTTLIQHSAWSSTHVIAQEMEIKGIWIGNEEMELFLSANEMTVYAESSNKSPKHIPTSKKWVQQAHSIQGKDSKINYISINYQ